MSLKTLTTSPLSGITVLVLLLALLLRFYIKFDTAERLFSAEELSLLNGTDEGLPILLGILGSVFDVTKGKSHYGSGGGYNHFAGRDASRAFVSGNFSGK
ncbi:Membrane-associated progesterone-binding protein 4 [Glycine soja]|uniref:Membrane-associated progesterone-binding protein 4 n=1 Tax=Glycine soja TaxID=3848 RepID=A0A445HB60_GLYSO|nr:Membrane-associated progesterone-binding protein 4 [Glycine soja]